jgi:GH25 family lysozyme M1 (1,4-beta-N-acetylmuramidase)
VLQGFDQSWRRALPATIGVSLAATLTVAGAAVLGPARHHPAYAASAPVPAAEKFSAPQAAALSGPPTQQPRPPSPTPSVAARVPAPTPAQVHPAQPTFTFPSTTVPSESSTHGALPPVTHPQDDRLGSTICSHEHCDPPPAAAVDGLGGSRSDSAPASATPTPTTSVAPKPSATHSPAPTVQPTTPRPTATRPAAPPYTAPAPPEGGPAPKGMDVSSYQGSVDWPAAYHRGARFAYIKATENTRYTNPYFSQQYDGARRAGLVRGAYHFALPDRSSGGTQGAFFVAHGGGWSRDGVTLPPMLDIEYNPYGPTCYGLTGTQMNRWVHDFSTAVHARTGRFPIIYTTRDWWSYCTASPNINATNPLFIACYCRSPGRMPDGWQRQTIWQYNDSGVLPGDQDLFNGSYADLRRFALGI